MTRGFVACALALAACGSVARLAGKPPARPEPEERDSITRLEIGCNLDYMGDCFELAKLYEHGWRAWADEHRFYNDEEDEEDEDVEYEKNGSPDEVPRVVAYVGRPRRELAPVPAKARALYERLCTVDRVDAACYEAGRMHRDGVGTPVDLATADAWFVHGCDLEEDQACTAHAYALEHGLGVDADVAAGRALMRATCDRGHARACTNAGVPLASGDGVERNDYEAHVLFERACRNNDPLGCHYWAVVIHRSSTSAQQLRRAFDYEVSACHAGVGPACAVAGRLYRGGTEETVEREASDDLTEEERLSYAAELFHKGCELGDADACQGYFLALLDGDGVDQDVRTASRMAEAQCADGHLPSCQSLAYFYELGLGVFQDLKRAEALYRKTCDTLTLDGAGSCSNLAELLADRGDRAQAVVFAHKGCDLGDARGCNTGGMFIVNGSWPGTRAEGVEMIQRACKLAVGADEIADYCGAAAGIR